MLEFLNELQEIKFGRNEKRQMMRKSKKVGMDFGDMMPRYFRAIECGDGIHYLSIQASNFHFCLPRETIDKDKYDAFEVAIMERDGNGSARFMSAIDFVRVDCELVQELDKYFDDTVFKMVPKELVQELFEIGRKVYGGQNG